MDKILSIQTIKNVFAALGAKTSDNNYGVALLDKTTAEPKGLMEMSDLASVLGAVPYLGVFTDANNATEQGIYGTAESGQTHVPEQGNGILVVLGTVLDNLAQIQFYCVYEKIFYRRIDSDGYSASRWIQL